MNNYEKGIENLRALLKKARQQALKPPPDFVVRPRELPADDEHAEK
jgi:hypothetical protein